MSPARREELAAAAVRRLAAVRAFAADLERARAHAHAHRLTDGWRPEGDDTVPVRFRLSHVAGGLDQAADQVATAARALKRLHTVLADSTRCGLPWAVCPDCLGQPLTSSGGTAGCRRCGRRWPTTEVEPCPWPVAATVRDRQGGAVRLCRSHVAGAARQLDGATVTWDSGGGDRR